jgi:hypothetical protein
MRCRGRTRGQGQEGEGRRPSSTLEPYYGCNTAVHGHILLFTSGATQPIVTRRTWGLKRSGQPFPSKFVLRSTCCKCPHPTPEPDGRGQGLRKYIHSRGSGTRIATCTLVQGENCYWLNVWNMVPIGLPTVLQDSGKFV